MSSHATRALGWLFVGLLAIGCAKPVVEESAEADSDLTGANAFDKNSVLTDEELRDSTSLSETQIQGFLDKTPWGHASVLASYEENGKSAATIIHDVSAANNINPLELLVRLQMEQSLVYKKAASNESITLAFGCGCPHSPVCSPAYEGFENQAKCAAGTLSRSIDKADSAQGTASGWKTGVAKKSQDGISITPDNAATAALYTYTPWVGEAGGGKKGVGGAGLHHQIWVRFAEAIDYKVGEKTAVIPKPKGGDNENKNPPVKTPVEPTPTPTEPTEPTTPPATPTPPSTPTPPATPTPPSTPTPPATPTPPSSPSPGPSYPAPGSGPNGGENSSKDAPGSEDDQILERGTQPPAADPPPRSTTSSAHESENGVGTSDDEDETSDDEDRPKTTKKKSTKVDSGGCSSTGHSSSNASSALPLLLAVGLVVSRRSKKK